MNTHHLNSFKYYIWLNEEVIAVAKEKELALMIAEQVPQSEVLDENRIKISY